MHGFGGGWEANVQLTKDHERQAREFLDAAEEVGANFFDHADIFGRGRAEEIFCLVLKERPSLRGKIVIQSKCGIRWADDPPGTPQRFDFSRDHILESVDAILARLRIDRVEILLLHRPDPLSEGEEIAEAFRKLRASGKVRYFGVSNQNRVPAWAVLAPNFNGKVQVSSTAPLVTAYNSWVFSRHGCSPGRGKKGVPFVAAQTNEKCLGAGSQRVVPNTGWIFAGCLRSQASRMASAVLS